IGNATQNHMLDSHFEVLNALAAEITDQGIEVTIAEDTICVGREQWDRYLQQQLMMVSAAPSVKIGSKAFRIYATEQYDSEGKLRKYSVKLCDDMKQEL